ncbi:MAG: roadblock/LC7 domain-containing protein [Chloroflexaceae bacterium]|nr:roadblock/LC7 domain-containing protein [Chloroflexaceae bacterium]NJL34566.1 roadblock/LC7 domain-containing protein [Chloroflexaceae bacterium]NJO05736.1 roadblock/LC7 domain-containing protein [Chloroflexaceae bacterium]
MSTNSTQLGYLLNRFRVMESIELAAVVASDGLLIESAAHPAIDVDAICAVASNGLAMAEALGREIDKGFTMQAVLEYEEGLVLLEPINDDAMLLLVTNTREELGHIRFLVALHRDDLLDALDAI